MKKKEPKKKVPSALPEFAAERARVYHIVGSDKHVSLAGGTPSRASAITRGVTHTLATKISRAVPGISRVRETLLERIKSSAVAVRNTLCF